MCRKTIHNFSHYPKNNNFLYKARVARTNNKKILLGKKLNPSIYHLQPMTKENEDNSDYITLIMDKTRYGPSFSYCFMTKETKTKEVEYE